MTHTRRHRDGYLPYDIDLEGVFLVNHLGNIIDIRNQVLEINVYEDIYDIGMKCDVVVSDSLGLIERIPLVGDEFVVVSFKTPTFDITRSLIFWVYSVKDREKHKDRSYSYVIHGVTSEILNDMRKGVEGSYNGRISDVVSKIYETALRPTQPEFSFISDRMRRIEIERTEGNQSFICPIDVNPIAFIRYLQKQAKSERYLPSDYMFWQNVDGWHFKTLSSLIDSEVFDSFYFTETEQEPDRNNSELGSPGFDEPVRKYQKIAFVNYNSQFDSIEAYGSGLYENTTRVVDTLRKKVRETSFRYNRDFSRLEHLSDKKFYTEDSPHKRIEDTGITDFFVGEIGENYSGIPYISNARGKDVRVTNPLKLRDVARFRRAGMAQLNNIILDIGIPGNSDIKAGDLIDVFLQQGSMEREYIDMNNILFGQKNPTFLITAVRHLFNRRDNQYTTIVQCTRDTYGITPRQLDT